MLRLYSWLCAEASFLEMLKEMICGVLNGNSDWLHSYLLYKLSGLSGFLSPTQRLLQKKVLNN